MFIINVKQLTKPLVRIFILTSILAPGFLNPGYTQTIDDRKFRFQKMDEQADKASRMNFSNPSKLAAFLIVPAKNDFEKTRSIYRWVSSNINYDTEGYFSGSYQPADAQSVMSSRKSVCEGYANVFDLLAKEAGLETHKISGYAKGYGYLTGSALEEKTNHAWNAVKIEGKWYLIDTTWGAGYLDGRSFVRRFEDHYFLTSPAQFIYDHLPEDSGWQLLDKPISKAEYAALPYLRPDFFRNGLKLIGYTTGIIKANEELLFTLGRDNKGNDDRRGDPDFLASLYENNRQLGKRQIIIQKKTGKIFFSVRFPKKGDYILRIFVRPGNQQGSYAWAGDFPVNAESGTSKVFPFAFENSGKQVLLQTPLEGDLIAGESYNFSLDAPEAEKVAVIAGKVWFYLTNEGSKFSGSVKAAKGDNTIFIKYPGESNFRGVYRYTGN